VQRVFAVGVVDVKDTAWCQYIYERKNLYALRQETRRRLRALRANMDPGTDITQDALIRITS